MNRGFSLIELIVVIGIIAILAIFLLPVSLNYYQREVLKKTEDQLVWILKEARDNAINQKNGSYFGLYITNDNFIIFQGQSYSQRILVEDVSYSFPLSINISGLKEIVFAPNTGIASPSGTISLSLGTASADASQDKRDIIINELGVISY
jgi:prepilin-type N-terminal cleavage/methylation domain-containing protein